MESIELWKHFNSKLIPRSHSEIITDGFSVSVRVSEEKQSPSDSLSLVTLTLFM
jgi:hypothetical protein